MISQTIVKELSAGLRDLSTRPKNNIATLDVLRTLAVTLVVSGHFAGEFGAVHTRFGAPLAYAGWTGVDLFFVLSGLLIGMQLWKELSRTGTIRIPTFLLRRGLRIWPLYYGFVLLVLVEALGWGRDRSGLWADASFLSNYFHNQVGGSWSLSTEEQFYIFVPLCLFVVSRVIKLRAMWIVPVAALIALPILRETYMQRYGVFRGRQLDYSPFHTHSDGLALGVLLAWSLVQFPDWPRRSKLAAMAVSAVMAALGAIVYHWNRDVFNFSSLALVYGSMTTLGLMLNPVQGFLNWRGFYVLSRLSYGIYLNHFGLLPRVVQALHGFRGQGATGFFICYGITYAACTVFALATFLCIEFPFLHLREKWLTSRRRAKLAAPLHDASPEVVEAHAGAAKIEPE